MARCFYREVTLVPALVREANLRLVPAAFGWVNSPTLTKQCGLSEVMVQRWA